MVAFTDVKPNTYFDSVTLMLLSSKLSAIDGVLEAGVMMGTNHNKALMIASGILSEEKAASVSPNDLIIGISANSQQAIDKAIQAFNEQLESKTKNAEIEGSLRVKTIDSAVKKLGDPNFAVVSLPGRYAKTQVMKLMKNGMHVLLFSDNVSLEEEIELKSYAVENNLLMMGPDCGTAIINGTALGFANVVRRGNIGLVAASGTGLQEVTCVIDHLGAGVSQALGTGGRDLKAAVGGKMMLSGLNALGKDPGTTVIGLISKPPDESVTSKILDAIQKTGKQAVVCFLGASKEQPTVKGVTFAYTLEDAAGFLVDINQGRQPKERIFSVPDAEIDNIVKTEQSKLNQNQKYARGLYSGGTLCYEGLLLLQREGFEIYSNIATDKKYELPDVEKSLNHTLIDMGEDYFTDGVPHPMIDFRLRSERLKKEAQDPEVGVILLDCVLGYGSHEDPAGALVETIRQAKAQNSGLYITYIASVCGTEADPQSLSRQAAKLREAGVVVMPTNAQAVRLAAKIIAGR